MALPPIPAAGHGGAPSPIHSVFIDTSLGTRLALSVSSSDTVADLKRKIRDEHTLYFPRFGVVKIDGLKVKRRGLYYHLAESMLVRSAFVGVKEDWFLSVEASVVYEDKEMNPKEANLGNKDNGFEVEGVNVDVLNGRLDVMPERGLLVSQRERNDLLVEVAGGAQLTGGDDRRGGEVLGMVPFVGGGSLREEERDEGEEAGEMEVGRVEIGEGLSNLDASSTLPEGASEVKRKRKKRESSPKIGSLREEKRDEDEAREMEVERAEIGEGLSNVDTSSTLSEGASDVKRKHKKRKSSEKGGSLREEKRDEEEAREMEVERAEIREGLSNADASSMLAEGASDVKAKRKKNRRKKSTYDHSGQDVDVSMHELGAKGGDEEIKVPETTALQERSEVVIGDVQISDQNVSGVSTGEGNGLAEESVAQVEHVESAKDGSKGYVVNERSDKPFKDNLDHLPGANKEHKTGKEVDDEGSLGESRTIVSEPNEVICEPPALSQLPTIDEEQFVTATQQGPNDDQLASQRLKKKKRKSESSKKVDKEPTVVTPDEANAGEEIRLKEAGIDSGNVAEELPPSDAHMLQPSAVSLTEKDPDALQEQSNNIFSQDNNVFHEPITDVMNKVETEREVPETVSTIVEKEAVDSILPEVDPSVNDGKASKKRRKSKKHKELINGTVSALSDALHVGDCSATGIPSSEPEKVGKAEDSIPETAEKGDVKEAAPADSLRASLLLSDREIDMVIKNVVESAQQSTNSEAVTENKDGKSSKKTKNTRGSDGKNSVLLTQAEDKCANENVLAPSTVNIHGTGSSGLRFDADLANPGFKDSLDRAEIGSHAEKVGGDAENSSKVDGVNFSSYFIPSERNKKAAHPSEVTGAWSEPKSKKKADISPSLPGSPTLKEKLEAQAKPQEKKAEPSSGKADTLKPHHEEAPESNAMTRPKDRKPKKGTEHHPESSANSTSHTKRGKKDQSQSQRTGLNGGGGFTANPGEVVDGTVCPKSVVPSRSLLKSDPFGDDHSEDSLEIYRFPSPRNQSRASSPDTYTNFSVSTVHSDGESDAGFYRNGSSGKKGMKTPFSSGIPLDTILKSSKRYKKAKLDAESQPEDFYPSESENVEKIVS